MAGLLAVVEVLLGEHVELAVQPARFVPDNINTHHVRVNNSHTDGSMSGRSTGSLQQLWCVTGYTHLNNTRFMT